jgi:outer membrane protein assembly factor BamB
MTKRKRIDLGSEEARRLAKEIWDRTFLSEGTMVAFPLCFPGASAPIPPDESHITALDVASDGTIYGGTSGRRVHLFAGAFHQATGAVFDLGGVEDATGCPAICCGTEHIVACVNGQSEGRLLRCPLQPLPRDLIQEWGFSRPRIEDLGPAVAGEKIVHAVALRGKGVIFIATEGHLLAMEIASGEKKILGEIPGFGCLAIGSQGSVFGLDEGESLWRYRPQDGSLERSSLPLPEGDWYRCPLRWARDPIDGILYTADGDGRLFAFAEEYGFTGPIGRTPLTPIGPMAVTFDGRLFGTCGDGIAQFFCYNPESGFVKSLGIAVSTIERRRYGYAFGDAVTGRYGQLFFGEDDDGGHIWIYFPSILPRASSSRNPI